MKKDDKSFEINKGLQMPLIFMIFKGKYIYYAFGALAVSIGLSAIVKGIVDVDTTIITFIWVVILLLLLGVVVLLQKQGLHSKKIEKGMYYIKPNYYTNVEEKEE